MYSNRKLAQAIEQIRRNDQQLEAVLENKQHCVVLAGPGSGKTKTLTVAMARALEEDVKAPRGIACVTYSHECASELKVRLRALAVEGNERTFIGTVHSFAMSHVIEPYARCVIPALAGGFKVASETQRRAAVEIAYVKAVGGSEDPFRRWRYAELKRRRDVDRTARSWREDNEELCKFIVAYERELRREGLIDFDDMPLLAFRMVKAYPWIGEALCARFPVLFVDEYQDLGHALHALVLRLCFQHGARLFAVGDPDQSIYQFNGADPGLLRSIAARPDVHEVQLRLNYRCGAKIIDASMAVLGEERGYISVDDSGEGIVDFYAFDGDYAQQAAGTLEIVKDLRDTLGLPLHEFAILYRTAEIGQAVSDQAKKASIPVIRSDNMAMVKRSSPVARFVEACAHWVVGGWKSGSPPFEQLVSDARMLVYGRLATRDEVHVVRFELASFLMQWRHAHPSLHVWLDRFRSEVINAWRARAREGGTDWAVVDELIVRTTPLIGEPGLSLSVLGADPQGTGCLVLSTLHSAKGREFDVVVLFAMNDDVLPYRNEWNSPDKVAETRRLFYVGVTRARKRIVVVFRKGHNSRFVWELFERVRTEDNA